MLSISMGMDPEQEIKECAEILKKAEAIRQDADKFKKVKEYLAKERNTIDSIDKLREHSNKIQSRSMEEPEYEDKVSEIEAEEKIDKKDKDKDLRMPTREEMNRDMLQVNDTKEREEYY